MLSTDFLLPFISDHNIPSFFKDVVMSDFSRALLYNISSTLLSVSLPFLITNLVVSFRYSFLSSAFYAF